MQENELKEQFKELEGDEQVQAAQATPAAEPTVAKRATVAGLKKELDELKQDMNRDVLEWLGQLDVRLEDVEKRTATHNEALLGDVKTRLDIIEREPLAEREDVAADIAARLDAVEGATGTIAAIMKSHLRDTEGQTQTPAAAAGFAVAPVQPEGEKGRTATVLSMANACQTMADVLMICRYLKNDPKLTDEERNEILRTAAERAGVQMTQGLQIRAGVRNVAE